MEDSLARIRAQLDSGLSNQKQVAVTLWAVEETLREQGVAFSPSAYFAALLTLSGQDASEDSTTVYALLYLLAIVLPHVPKNVLKSQFSTTLGYLIPYFETCKLSAPNIRSLLGCLEALLSAQDAVVWNSSTTRQAFQLILLANIDSRPKVRKKAQDVVYSFLSHAPPPSKYHPMAAVTALSCLNVLQEKTQQEPVISMHVLNLLRRIISHIPPSELTEIVEILLNIPKFHHNYLTFAAFEVFDNLFVDFMQVLENDKMAKVLKTLLQLKPSSNDAHLNPMWLRVMSAAYISYVKADVNLFNPTEYLSTVLMILEDIKTGNVAIVKAAGTSVCQIIEHAPWGSRHAKEEANTVKELVNWLENQGLNIHYKKSWASVIEIITFLIKRHGNTNYEKMKKLVVVLADFRRQQDFPYKIELDMALGAAINAFGPNRFLSLLPLNLEAESDGRAYLLPILQKNIQNTNLEFFVKTLIPLADRMEQTSNNFESKNRSFEAKVYTTLNNQIWMLLPGFFTLPLDLEKAMTTEFVERLRELLTHSLALRSVICSALQVLIEEFKTLQQSDLDGAELLKKYGMDQTMAIKALSVISSFAPSFLATLSSLYGEAPKDQRGYILSCLRCFLQVTEKKDIESAFSQIHQKLAQMVTLISHNETQNVFQVLLDLAIGMCDYLASSALNSLYEISLQLIQQNGHSIQKKSYKALSKIYESELGNQIMEQRRDELLKILVSVQGLDVAAARRERLMLLLKLLKSTSDQDLHFILLFLSETILSTKDVNGKARTLAFELLVEMGQRMKNGGLISVEKLAELDITSFETVPTVSLKEFFTMVSAGIAGSTPHMISATIGAVARLVFEFKHDLSKQELGDIFNTNLYLLNGANREVVRSALGFVKVALVCYPPDLFRSFLPELIPTLIKWSHQPKSRFRVKVRFILERMVRKYGVSEVEPHMPEEDLKLLVNIRKQQDRQKRKQIERKQMGKDEPSGRVHEPESFEQILYGSEDEENNDEELEEEPQGKGLKRKGHHKELPKEYILEDEDGPIDFLDHKSIAKMTTSKPKVAGKKNIGDSFRASIDGKLIINDSSDEEEAKTTTSLAKNTSKRRRMTNKEEDEDGEIEGGGEDEDVIMDNPYLEAVMSSEAFTRTQRNKIKFSNKKNPEKGNDDEDEEVGEMTDKAQSSTKNKKKENIIEVAQVGKTYRSKNAKGDVKKPGQLEPYAYIPLNPKMASKRRGSRIATKLVKRGKKP